MSKDSTASSSKWDDLKTRVISGAILLVVGLFAIWAGGIWFSFLVAFAAGLMIWELATMCAPDQSKEAAVLTALAASVCAAQSQIDPVFGYLSCLLLPFVGAIILKKNQVLFGVFAFAVGLGTYFLIFFREEIGISFIFWVLAVIIASDTLGYLAGRTFGGPKFWPKISPKKTWSGTIAGWIGAAVVGLIFAIFGGFQVGAAVLALISMVVAFAGQMGDIAESALKRRLGIKDSSDLIPGHGGLLDRFDALIGAVLGLGVVTIITGGALF